MQSDSPSGQNEVQRIAVDCSNARNMCLQTLNYCLSQSGKYSDKEIIKRIEDCAVLCEATISFLLRDSRLLGPLLRVCATACEKCSQSCEQIPGDEQLETCAHYCRVAFQSCSSMNG